MDIDGNLPSPSHSQLVKYTNDTTMPTHMEEELETIDLGDLDILALELACHRKAFDKIPLRQIESPKVALFIAQQRNSLGLQAGSLWDGKKSSKSKKKEGARQIFKEL